jgi:large subunit ribosomal protein L4
MAMVVKKEKTEKIEKTAKVSTRVTRAKKVVEKAKNTTAKSTLSKISDPVFNQPQNPALTSQYIRTYQFNQRQGNAQTKTRGDVSGSGKKPWKQKGTGRARVGSIRTPVWRHGGISHGPVAKDWCLSFPKKMNAKARLLALSNKVAKSRAFFVENFKISEGRTKEVLALIQGWNLTGKMLLVLDQQNHNLQKGSANLKNIQVVNVNNLNGYQVLWAKAVIFEKSALDKLIESYKAKEHHD